MNFELNSESSRVYRTLHMPTPETDHLYSLAFTDVTETETGEEITINYFIPADAPILKDLERYLDYCKAKELAARKGYAVPDWPWPVPEI